MKNDNNQMQYLKAVELNNENLKGNLFYTLGNDSYWLSVVENFFSSLADPSLACFNLSKLENLQSSVDLQTALSQIPFDSDKTVVIIKEYTRPTDKVKGEITKLLNNVAPDCVVLLMRAEDVLTPTLKGKMIGIDCGKLDDLSIMNYLLKKSNISRDSALYLSKKCERDMAIINNELFKLSAYCDGNEITNSDIDEVVCENIETQIFILTNAIIEKNANKALTLLEKYVINGLSYNQVLSILTNQFRVLLYAKISNLTDDELAKTLNIHSFVAKKAKNQAKNHSQKKLKEILEMLIDTEFAFKSGKINVDTAIKNAITKISING